MKQLSYWCIFGAMFWFAFGEHRERDWPFQLGALLIGVGLYLIAHFTGEDEDEGIV